MNNYYYNRDIGIQYTIYHILYGESNIAILLYI